MTYRETQIERDRQIVQRRAGIERRQRVNDAVREWMELRNGEDRRNEKF